MDEAEQVGAAFVAAMSATIGSPVRLRTAPVRLSGGFWAQIWKVDLDNAPAPFDGPMVLRVMPDRNAGRREAIVQGLVADAGCPTPRVLASGSAPGLGESYLVMERVVGRTPLGGLQLGPELVRLPKLLQRLPKMLAAVATQLHAIDPSPLRLALADSALDGRSNQNPFRGGIDVAAIESPRSGFVEVGQWLNDHLPIAGPDVICHGDLHPLNLLIDEHDAAWLLDWTTATIAPKEMDIGLTAGLLRCAPMAVPRPLRSIVSRITNWLAESFIDEMSTTAPLDRAAVDWWEALQHARCLAELTRGRNHPGSVVGPGHPFETSLPAMQRRLHQLTGITIVPPVRTTTEEAMPPG